MKIFGLTILLAWIILFESASPVFSKDAQDFNSYMKSWNINIEKASKYLKDAENEFKKGDELQGCVMQRKAAKYGINGTESLIKSFEAQNSTEGLSNIKSGLNKWKELRDFC